MSALSVLNYIFPAPKYTTLPSVGVDISDTSLKYVQFRRKKVRDKNLELYKYGDLDIPHGAVEGGTIKDAPKLVEILKQVEKECGTPYVRLSLPEERAYLFETTIDKNTPYKDIRGHLEFKLEENVPLSPRDAYFDYEIVGAKKDEADHLITVAVYARDTINSYHNVCIDADLMPLSFEVEAQAIGRATTDPHDRGTYMIVDFGKTRTGIGIVHRGVLMYTSTVDIGGVRLSQALRGVLGEMPEDEYSKIKNTQGLFQIEENQAYTSIEEVIAEVKEEIETRLQYWNSRSGGRKDRAIDQIILCGGSSNLAGLPEYFESTLKISTERARVWQNAFSLESFIPPITRRYSYGYATAVGLALGDFVHHD